MVINILHLERFGYRELGMIRDLINSYFANHCGNFTIEKIAFNDHTASCFIIDEAGNYWVNSQNQQLRKLTMEEVQYQKWSDDRDE